MDTSQTRRFVLLRERDITGVSGTGIVADGVQWPDGRVTIMWRGDRPSEVSWQSIEHAEAVHGHDGASRIVWVDRDEPDGVMLLLRINNRMANWTPVQVYAGARIGHRALVGLLRFPDDKALNAFLARFHPDEIDDRRTA